MVIADTSIWIELLRGHSTYIPIFKELFSKNLVLALECIFGELLYGAKNREEEKLLLEYWRYLPKVNSYQLFIDAGLLAFREKLYGAGIGILDAVIIIAARRQNAQIWTLDKKMMRVLSPHEIFTILS